MRKGFLSRLLGIILLAIVFFVPIRIYGASNPANFTFDISEGSITIAKGTNANTLKVTYATGIVLDNIPIATSIVLTGTATNGNLIVISGAGVTSQMNITLSNLSVDVSGISANYCAFALSDKAKVNMKLVGNNTLISGYTRAGLRVASLDEAELIITADSTSATLTAKSGNATTGKGAGIGGNSGPNGGQNGKIQIDNGTVNASSIMGAGIGGGTGTTGPGGIGTMITINGGIINVQSNSGAGIGGGYSEREVGGTAAAITIVDGTITAKAIYGAGIGSGAGKTTGGTASAISINSGTITSTSEFGAGIGAGYGETGGGEAGSLIINGGTIVANSNQGAGIGGGASKSGAGGNAFAGGSIVIYGGSVESYSKIGAGVGGGYGATMGLGNTGILDGGKLIRSRLQTNTDTNFSGSGTEYSIIKLKVVDTGNLPLSDVKVIARGVSPAILGMTDANGEISFTIQKPSSPMGQNGADYTFDFTKSDYVSKSYDIHDIYIDQSGIIVMNKVVPPPTVTADIPNKLIWDTNPVLVTLTYKDGYGNPIASFMNTRYSISSSPTFAGAYLPYPGSANIFRDGVWYLHYSVRDLNYNSGQWVKGVFGPYRISPTPPPLSSDKDITSLSALGKNGVIRGTAIYLTVPFGTDISSVTPTITHLGVSISPTTPQDFSNGKSVTYTVTAEDGSTKTYVARIGIEPSPTVPQINSFSILGVNGVINGHDIYLTLPSGTDLKNLLPTISYINTTTILPDPLDGIPEDFSVSPKVYTLTAPSVEYYVHVDLEQEEIVVVETPPYVEPASPTNLQLNGTNTASFKVDFGEMSNHLDQVAVRAEIYFENGNLGVISQRFLLGEGTFTISGILPGQTNLIVRFYDMNGELINYRVIIPVTVIGEITGEGPGDGGSENGGNENGGGSGGGSGGSTGGESSSSNTGNTYTPYVPPKEHFIDAEGRDVPEEVITVLDPSYTIFVSEGSDGDATVTIPANAFKVLEAKNSKHILNIKTEFGVIKIPVQLPSQIENLENIIGEFGLSKDELIYKVSLKDLSKDQIIRNEILNLMPDGKLVGPIVDFKIEIYSAIDQKLVAVVSNFTKPIERLIPIIESNTKDFASYKYLNKKEIFVPHLHKIFEKALYSSISSKTNSVYFAADNPKRFDDVKNNEWYTLFVERAAAKGLIKGQGNGMFNPKDMVTRAEFVQMMVAAMNPKAENISKSKYKDLMEERWYYSSVSRAEAAGWLEKFSDENFMPNKAITREEMASILSAILKQSKDILPEVETAHDPIEKVFTDFNLINKIYVEDVQNVFNEKIMQGLGNNTFSPEGLTTRAEASTVQIILLEKFKMID